VDSCEVLIVGGGPGGSTCARELAAAGVDVCVIDKSGFPRDKVCAGWITPQVVRSLELDLDEYALGRTLQPIRAFTSGALEDGASAVVAYDEVVSHAIRRCEFDDYLLRRSGAGLRLGESVRRIERDARGWVVNGEIAARMLVGAGGHFCPVARWLGAELGGGESIVAAQEAEFTLSPEQAARCTLRGEQAELYFCSDLRGYGWCVRKGDMLNIGLGREDNHALAEHVQAFWEWLERVGKVPDGLEPRFKGHAYLLYSRSRRPLMRDGVLLVGDAAGLAYPQSGEGIRPAVESGIMAAQAILAARGDYRRTRLARYLGLLATRYGRRSGSRARPPHTSGTFSRMRNVIARNLLVNPHFARRVVLDEWFLHRRQPALRAFAAGARPVPRAARSTDASARAASREASLRGR
jgi:geranylgeranyl reductase family protein